MSDTTGKRLQGTGRHLVKEDRYVLVLLLTLATIVSSAFLGVGVFGVVFPLGLMSLTLAVTLSTSDAGPRALLIGRITLLVAFVGVTAAALLNDTGAGRAAFFFMMLALSVGTPLVIARRLSQHLAITVNTVAGAADMYLLVGLFFAVVYSSIGVLQAGGFHMINPANAGSNAPSEAFFYASRPTSASDFLYFSYITMTTVGYGDLTATSALGRMLAATQALIGQLYLVTVVAIIVGNVGRKRRGRLVEHGDGDEAPEER